MRILKNRVVISLLVILVVVYFWEFWIKPVTGPAAPAGDPGGSERYGDSGVARLELP
jgi:hypothetical protein